MIHQRVTGALGLTIALIGAGCDGVVINTSWNPRTNPSPTTLVSATGRTIPEGAALAFSFTPVAGRRVNISVQANTDRANPDFLVVRGEIDYADLQNTPISDLILIGADEGSGQEVGSFTPEVVEPYTLFVEDANNRIGATFSVFVTQ